MVTAFTGYVWREAKLEKKIAVFEKKKKKKISKQNKHGYVWTGPWTILDQ